MKSNFYNRLFIFTCLYSLSGYSFSDDFKTRVYSEYLPPIEDGRVLPPLPPNAEKVGERPNTVIPAVDDNCVYRELYSSDRWQWISYKFCGKINKTNSYNNDYTFAVTDAQYYWGGAWYRFKKTDPSTDRPWGIDLIAKDKPFSWRKTEMFGVLNGSSKTATKNFYSPLSGEYRLFSDSQFSLYWGDYYGSNVFCENNCYIDFTYGGDLLYNQENNKLQEKIDTARQTEKAVVYQFDQNNLIPLKYGNTLFTLRQDAHVVIIPKASRKTDLFLFGDTHKGQAARCENTPYAQTTSGVLEQAELYTVDQLWKDKMLSPDILFNANYFDVRPQLHSTTWKENKCSSPLGIYYDNDKTGPTQGTHNDPNRFFPGEAYFVSENGAASILDTLFITKQKYPGEFFNLVENKDLNSSFAINKALELERNNNTFIGVSGTSLYNNNPSIIAPDSGDEMTTRIALGYNEKDDILYLIIGGSYREGMNREVLKGFFNNIDVYYALELDGGGSASLGLKKSKFGDINSLVTSSCPEVSELWCSPVKQPDGQRRIVPSWIGINIIN